MKTSTKIVIAVISTILIVITVVFCAFALKKTGTTYYTQIINEGVAVSTQPDEEGRILFTYTEPAFDKDGNEIEITFTSLFERALRVDAYLSVVYNEKYGVISYSEVQRDELPEKAREGLDRYAD